MDDETGKDHAPKEGSPASAKAVREAKLAQALRDNLRRRKSQASAKPAAAAVVRKDWS